jgi:hypothetical protein
VAAFRVAAAPGQPPSLRLLTDVSHPLCSPRDFCHELLRRAYEDAEPPAAFACGFDACAFAWAARFRCSAQRRFCAIAIRLRAASLSSRFLGAAGSPDAVEIARPFNFACSS